jgi:hypothetical protein
VNKFMESAVSVAVAIIGLAIVAVLVSSKSNTGSIITNAGSAFGTVLKDATNVG